MHSNKPLLQSVNVEAWIGDHHILKGINLEFAKNQITAIIGPSGCGKSTFVRCLNRLHEEIPDSRLKGKILYHGEDIYANNVDPVQVRRKIGMVFQKPNPFPSMSIQDNVTVGLRLSGITDKHLLQEAVEVGLKKAALWDEVKDKLNRPGTGLSGGQQQRLCIARTLAVNPEIILMDEPTSALDPIAAAKIEELMVELRKDYTVIVVTHNMQQATRVSDNTCFFVLGEVIEAGTTEQIFNNPKNAKTKAYISGEFG